MTHGHGAGRRPIRVYQHGRCETLQIDLENDGQTFQTCRAAAPRTIGRASSRSTQSQTRSGVVVEHFDEPGHFVKPTDVGAGLDRDASNERRGRRAEVHILVDVSGSQFVEQVAIGKCAGIDHHAACDFSWNVQDRVFVRANPDIAVGRERDRMRPCGLTRKLNAKRLVRAVLADHQWRMERFVPRREGAVVRSLELEIRDHAEPATRGMEVRADLIE